MAELSLLPQVQIGDRVKLCGGEKGEIINISNNLGFNSYEIRLESSSKVVTEARYRFDLIPGRVIPPAMPLPRPQQTLSQTITTLGPASSPQEECDVLSNQHAYDSDDELLNIDVDKFIRDEQNKNTQKKTESDMNKLSEFLCQNLKESRSITRIPPQELCKLLCIFFMNVKGKDGKDLEPSTVKGISCSIDRYLKCNDYGLQISTSKEFQKVTEVIKTKQKKLKRYGKGNLENKADPLSDEDINKLYETKQLGNDNPESLLRTVWFNNTIHFGMRGITEHHQMKWGDVVVCNDPENGDYLQYNERQTKTRHGSNPRNVRALPPKAWSTPETPSRCPVVAYNLYKQHRPTTYCLDDSPFYISTNTNLSKSHKWYKAQPVGVNKLGKFMSTMAKSAGLTGSKSGSTAAPAKRLTNHSARKYLVQKLNDSGVPPNQIMQISGHRNIQSINSYSSLNTKQHKAISDVISNTDNNTLARPSPGDALQIPRAMLASSSLSTVTMTDRRNPGVFNGPIYGGTFTITINHVLPKRPRVIYSDESD